MIALVAPLFTPGAFLGPLGSVRTAGTANPRPVLRHAAVSLAEVRGKGMGEFGYPEPGPMPLVGERDACGVGFIADKKARRRHDTIQRALHALDCMEHRGGCGGDGVSGDGAGVMTSVPWELFEAEGVLNGHPSSTCGVAMTFLPQEEADAVKVRALLEKQVKQLVERRSQVVPQLTTPASRGRPFRRRPALRTREERHTGAASIGPSGDGSVSVQRRRLMSPCPLCGSGRGQGLRVPRLAQRAAADAHAGFDGARRAAHHPAGLRAPPQAHGRRARGGHLPLAPLDPG